MFKLFTQINVSNGSRTAAALDLVQRQIPFEQNDGKDLDWASLRKALSPDNGPGVVSIKDLQNRHQSPVYLREEIVRRLKLSSNGPGKRGENPLHVFVLIGSPMDEYVFPKLTEIETGNEEDCVIYYVQVEFLQYQGIYGRSRQHREDVETAEGTDVSSIVTGRCAACAGENTGRSGQAIE